MASEPFNYCYISDAPFSFPMTIWLPISPNTHEQWRYSRTNWNNIILILRSNVSFLIQILDLYLLQKEPNLNVHHTSYVPWLTTVCYHALVSFKFKAKTQNTLLFCVISIRPQASNKAKQKKIHKLWREPLKIEI